MVEENKYIAHWVIFDSRFFQAFLDCRGSTIDDVSPSRGTSDGIFNPDLIQLEHCSLRSHFYLSQSSQKNPVAWDSTEAMKQLYRLKRSPVKMSLKFFYHPHWKYLSLLKTGSELQENYLYWKLPLKVY
jgi:hypothetical protein